MKVAIAGTGNVASYLTEEFLSSGFEVVSLTRKIRPNGNPKVEYRETDYTLSSLINALQDIDALVSTVADYENPSAATQTHLTMLEACEKSPKTKSYIPSEWTNNVEDFPEQPMFFAEANKTLHTALKQSKDVRWTIVSNGWFVDYIVPQAQRYLRDVGELWPMNYEKKEFTFYGPGTQKVTFTAVRDVAKAVAALLTSKDPVWPQYTYLEGQQIAWKDLFAILKKRDPEWTSKTKTLADTINQIVANESFESVLGAKFEVLNYSGALEFPKEKVLDHRDRYFKNVHFRTVEEMLDEAAARPDSIL